MRRALVLALLLGGCRARSPAADAGPPAVRGKDVAVIHYQTNAPDDAFPTTVEVDASGRTRVVVGCNRHDPAHGVGVFEHTVAGARISPLVALLSSPAFAALGLPQGLLPGSVVRRLSLARPGQPPVEKYAGETSPTQGPFVDAEQQLLVVRDEVLGHPVRALALELARVSRIGGEVSVSLKVVGVGDAPVRLPVPARWHAAAGELALALTRTDVPLAELRDHHRVVVAVTPQGIVAQRPATPPDGTFDLGKGQALDLELELPAQLAPGAYDVEAWLQLPLADERGQPLVSVEVHAKKRALLVR